MRKKAKLTDEGYIELYNDDGQATVIKANASAANTEVILPATNLTVAAGIPAVGSDGEVLTVVSGAAAWAAAGVPQTSGGTYTSGTGGVSRVGYNANTLNQYGDIGDYMPEIKLVAQNLTALITDLKNLGIIP